MSVSLPTSLPTAEDPQDKSRAMARSAGKCSSIINLANTTIGAGILGLPYAFAKAGLVWSLVLLFFVFFLTILSYWFLYSCADTYQTFTFGGISRAAFGSFGGWFADLVTFALMFCTLWSYVILIGDLLVDLFTPVCENCLLVNRFFVVGIVMLVVVVPLSFIRLLSSLKLISFLALVGMALCLVVLIVRLIVPFGGATQTTGFESIITYDSMVLLAFPIITFAFFSQQNVPVVYGELRSPSKRTMSIVSWISLLVCLVFYLVMGLIGYLVFGSKVAGNVLLSFDTADPLAIVARVGVLVTIIFSYPVIAHPARGALFNMLCTKRHPGTRVMGPCCPCLGGHCASRTVLAVLGLLIAAGNYVLGVYMTRVEFVLAIVGASLCSILAYILPGIYYLRMRTKVLHAHLLGCKALLAWLVVLAGIAFGSISLSLTILEMVRVYRAVGGNVTEKVLAFCGWP